MWHSFQGDTHSGLKPLWKISDCLINKQIECKREITFHDHKWVDRPRVPNMNLKFPFRSLKILISYRIRLAPCCFWLSYQWLYSPFSVKLSQNWFRDKSERIQRSFEGLIDMSAKVQIMECKDHWKLEFRMLNSQYTPIWIQWAQVLECWYIWQTSQGT